MQPFIVGYELRMKHETDDFVRFTETPNIQS